MSNSGFTGSDEVLNRTWKSNPESDRPGGVLISLLCPTRGRPHNMARMWESAINMAHNPDSIEVVYYLDNDDVKGMQGLPDVAQERAKQVRAVIGARKTLSKCWNSAAEIARGDILMLCGDDVVFRSQDWDRLVVEKIESYEDRIVLVYGRDGIQDERLGTHLFVHRNWVEATGYFVPPLFTSDYSDTWLNEVAISIGRVAYIPEIFTEHMHFAAGKSPKDDTYMERLERHKAGNVDQIWRETRSLRRQDAEKLQRYIESRQRRVLLC